MTDNEIIAVVTAHKEGKKIEERFSGFPENEWSITTQPMWNFVKRDYRIALDPRKPREFWAEIYPSGGGQIFTSRNQLTQGGELIRVREVIE